MMSKVQPAADQPRSQGPLSTSRYFLEVERGPWERGWLQIIKPLTEKTWERYYVIFSERKNKERNGETPLTTGKYLK